MDEREGGWEKWRKGGGREEEGKVRGKVGERKGAREREGRRKKAIIKRERKKRCTCTVYMYADVYIQSTCKTIL